MNVKKLKRLFVLLLIVLVVVIAFARFGVVSKIKNSISSQPSDEFDVTTNVTVDFSNVNQPKTKRLIKDYFNPTLADKGYLNEEFGLR